MVIMLRELLPTTYVRAVLVTLCYAVMVLIVAGVFASIAFVVTGGTH
jgi:hypothetical protein